MNNDGEVKDYLYTYVLDDKVLIRLQPYENYIRDYFPVEVIPRENRFYGQGIIERIHPIYKVIKTLSDQAIDTTTITTVPTFKITDDVVDNMESEDFYPGRMFRFSSVQDFDKFQQIQMSQPQLYSIQIAKSWENMAELAVGISYYHSGQESPTDPRAPAAKTMALVQEGNTRIDNYIKSIKQCWEKILNYTYDLIYENAGEEITYTAIVNGQKENKVFKRRDLRTGKINFYFRGTSVTENRNLEKFQDRELYGLIAQHPLVANNPKINIEALKTFLASQGDKWSDLQAVLPKLEEMQQQQQQMVNQAVDSYMQGVGVNAQSLGQQMFKQWQTQEQLRRKEKEKP